MKRETNEKIWKLKELPTTSSFGNSMRSNPIQIIITLFTVFSFCLSCQHNFVFARLGSPAKTSMSQPCQLTLLFNQPTFSLATTLPINSHATCWHESIRWSKIISELININFNKSTHYLDWTTLFMLSVYIKIAATMMVRESWAVRMP